MNLIKENITAINSNQFYYQIFNKWNLCEQDPYIVSINNSSKEKLDNLEEIKLLDLLIKNIDFTSDRFVFKSATFYTCCQDGCEYYLEYPKLIFK